MNKTILTSVGLVSAGVATGSVCTYFGVRGRLKKKYQDIADEEIASVKRTYALLRKEGEFSDPEKAVQAYRENVKGLEYASEQATGAAFEAEVEQDIQAVADRGKEVVRSIFDDDTERAIGEALQNDDVDRLDQILSIQESARREAEDPSSDEAEEETRFDELEARNPQKPFHISKDEYFDYSNEFDKLTITYYEGDDTLTDDKEQVIRNLEEVVGRDNLSKFGQDSEDKNITYVRNEKLRTDYEIILDTSSYTSVVLGIPDETPGPRIRRMRDDE